MTELRPVAGNTLPMGPSGDGTDMIGIHWTWKHDYDNVVNAAAYLYNHMWS